jgi:hypothetical protein
MYLKSMSNTTIIWDAMSVIIKDEHPVLYQYIKGRERSREYAVMRLTGIIAPIFIGAFDDVKIRSVAKQFLNRKEIEYIKGIIKIKLYGFRMLSEQLILGTTIAV